MKCPEIVEDQENNPQKSKWKLKEKQVEDFVKQEDKDKLKQKWLKDVEDQEFTKQKKKEEKLEEN